MRARWRGLAIAIGMVACSVASSVSAQQPAPSTPRQPQPAQPATQPQQTPPRQTPNPAQTPGQQAVEYATIDRATVRVFALSSVDVTEVSTPSGRRRWLAIPIAGHGSGVVLSSDGLVLTAAHVVEGARLVAVALPGVATPLPARVLYADARRDFAFLAVGGDHGFFVPLPETPPALRVREAVAAIGYPLDADRADPQSTSGIVAGLLPSGDIQLGISLNAGNSGGPLVNAAEQLVGIVVARVDPRTGAQGIGMAVPLGPVIAAHREQIVARGLHAAARTELAAAATSEALVARAVSLLVRLGLDGIGREIRALIDSSEGDIVALLREMPAESTNADASALRAALIWDALAVLLERRGVQVPNHLPPDRERELALRWEGETVASVHAGVRADATLPRRSPFVAFILRYWPVPVEAPPEPERPATRGWSDEDRVEDVAPPVDGARSPSRLGGFGGLSFPQAPDSSSIEPGGVLVGGGVTYVLAETTGVPRAGLVLGADALLGSWGGDAAFMLGAAFGLRIGVGGSERGIAWIHASWSPALSVLDGYEPSLTGAAFRIALGARVGPASITVAWRSMGRDEGPSYHAIELAAGAGL